MEEKYNMDQPQENLFERMQKIFNEREIEYDRQNEEFRKRKEVLDQLSESLTQRKLKLDAYEKELKGKEVRLAGIDETCRIREEQYHTHRRQMQEKEQKFEEYVKRINAEIEEKKIALTQELQLTLEEQKTKNMKLSREAEEIKRERELLQNGLPDVDLSQYILLGDVERNYLLVETVEHEYVSRSEHQRIINELQMQKDEAVKEKTDLFKKLLSTQTEAPKQAYEEPGEPETVSELPLVKEDESRKESNEDITAETVKSYLDKNSHGFDSVDILHSIEGDQLLAKKGVVSYRIMFGHLNWFDISKKRKNDAYARKLIDQFNNSPNFKGIIFEHKDGAVTATGYFTSDIPAHELIERIETISRECLEE